MKRKNVIVALAAASVAFATTLAIANVAKTTEWWDVPPESTVEEAIADAVEGIVSNKADATKDVATTLWRFDATGLILEPDADDIWAADDANYMQYVADRGVYLWTLAGYGEGLCYGGADAAALTNATGTAYTFTRLNATNRYDVAYMDDVAAAISTLSNNVYTKAEAATKDELDAKLDKTGVAIGTVFIGFTDEGIYVRDVETGKGTMLSDNKMAIKTATGEVFYYAYPNRSGTFALASDIPASMAWGAITGKPTTISGYGITDALKSDFTSLTNNAAFSSAVAAVSPPADTSALEARGFVDVISDDEIYFTTITTTEE